MVSKLFWILLLGVVAASLAETVEETTVKEQDVEVVGEDLPTTTPATVEEEKIQDLESDESGSSEEREDTRGFFVDSQGQKRCNCDGVSCTCCVSPNIPVVGRIKSCLKVSILANEKAVELELSGRDKVIGTKKINLSSKEAFCANLPGSLSTAECCIDANTSNLNNNEGLQACPKIELKALGESVATINFACIQYAKGKGVSFNNNGRVKAAQKVSFQLGNVESIKLHSD